MATAPLLPEGAFSLHSRAVKANVHTQHCLSAPPRFEVS